MASAGDTSEEAFQRAWLERTAAARVGAAAGGGALMLPAGTAGDAAGAAGDALSNAFAGFGDAFNNALDASRWWTVAIIVIALVIGLAIIAYLASPVISALR